MTSKKERRPSAVRFLRAAFFAGGYVNGSTARMLREQGIHIYDVPQSNDAYHALRAA